MADKKDTAKTESKDPPKPTAKPEPQSPSDGKGGFRGRGGRGGSIGRGGVAAANAAGGPGRGGASAGGRGGAPAGGGRGAGAGGRGASAGPGGRGALAGVVARGGFAERGRGAMRGGADRGRSGFGGMGGPPQIKNERDMDGRGRGMDQGRNGGGRFGSPDFHNGDVNMMMMLEEPVNKEPKKFIGRCRLFVGNIPSGMTEEKFKDLFKEYGSSHNAFFQGQKGFGLISLEYIHQAQKAKSELDGKVLEGASRPLRVRFSSHPAALKIKNLAPTITNEFLEKSFSMFGKVERAVVACNEQGRSLCEGVVEFERKNAAQQAIQRINSGAFLLTPGPRPIVVEQIEHKDEDDGFSEETVKKTPDYYRDREAVPRFAGEGTFEAEFSQRWKQLYDLEKTQREQLEEQIKEARGRLLEEEGFAVKDWQTQQLRRELEERQQQLDRMEEMHNAERIRREEMRKRQMEEEEMRIKQMGGRGGENMMGGRGGGPGGMGREEEMMMRRRQEEEMMRREERMMMRGGMRGGLMGRGGPRGGDGILGPGGPGGPGGMGRGDGIMGSPDGVRGMMKGEGSPLPLMHGRDSNGEPGNKRSRWN